MVISFSAAAPGDASGAKVVAQIERDRPARQSRFREPVKVWKEWIDLRVRDAQRACGCKRVGEERPPPGDGCAARHVRGEEVLVLVNRGRVEIENREGDVVDLGLDRLGARPHRET